ncbi:MAG: hypothetical protein JRI75_04935, partial [Deltaproteobacteria bacterium]|nr:hypothetical protein [Deltaproteobacteria bacterium]
MRLTENYKDIHHTLEMLLHQAAESVPYCVENLPSFENPQDMWHFLKNATTYKLDPPGIEMIQTAHSLFHDNYHNITGAGDCDCFTVLTIAATIANSLGTPYIELRGNNKRQPSHIYS